MNTEAFNEIFESMHTASLERGWWSDPVFGLHTEPNGLLIDSQLARYLVATKIALIHSEISEALEGYRKNKMDEHLPHRKSIEVELADAIIRIGDLAGALGLDVGGAIVEKMAFNAVRNDHSDEARRLSDGKKF